MNNMPYAAAEIEEEEALWESFCITCEPTGAGLMACGEPDLASLKSSSKPVVVEAIPAASRN